MSFWKSYRTLSPQTRLLFGLGLMGWAAFGIWASPQVESALGMVASEQEKAELERKLKVKISTVDKD